MKIVFVDNIVKHLFVCFLNFTYQEYQHTHSDMKIVFVENIIQPMFVCFLNFTYEEYQHTHIEMKIIFEEDSIILVLFSDFTARRSSTQ